MTQRLFRPSSEVLDRIASSLARRRVDVTIVGDEACDTLGQEVVLALIARGVTVRRISWVADINPAPIQPYSFQLVGDVARLAISPATARE